MDLYGAQAATPLDYVDHCWGNEPFAPGGPNPAVPPYAHLAHAPALTEPHGRIHWAGTETSTYWSGYMDGAVRAGERAAVEVGERL